MPIDTEQQLDREITKWHQRLHDCLKYVTAKNTEGEDLLQNARAYNKDASYFYEHNDLVRSFEAVIWAWAYVDIGLRYHLLAEQEA